MRVLCVAVLVLLALSGGCAILPSHIHSPASQAQAEEAGKALDSYTENSVAVYGAMLANLGKFKVEEDRVLADFAANRTAAGAMLLAQQTPQELQATWNAANTTRANLETLIMLGAKDYLRERGLAVTDVATAEGLIEKAKEAVKQAREDVVAWNETVAVLERGVGEVPALLAPPPPGKDGTAAGKDAGATIEERLGDLGEEEVQFLDADGKARTKKIKDIVAARAKAILAAEGGGAFPDAPGIKLRILTLGLELAELQKESAQARLEILGSRAELIEDAFAELKLVKKLLEKSQLSVFGIETQTQRVSPAAGQALKFDRYVEWMAAQARPLRAALDLTIDTAAKDELKEVPDVQARAAAIVALELMRADDPRRNELPRLREEHVSKNTAERAARQQRRAVIASPLAIQVTEYRDRIDPLSESLVAVRQLAVADAIAARLDATFPLGMRRLDHEDSITRSRANTRIYQALTRGGIDGLEAYHRGGLKPEDVANIIRIAQTIALGFIAAD